MDRRRITKVSVKRFSRRFLGDVRGLLKWLQVSYAFRHDDMFFSRENGSRLCIVESWRPRTGGTTQWSLSMIFDLPTIDKYPYIVGPLQPQIPTFSESGPSNVRAVRSAGP